VEFLQMFTIDRNTSDTDLITNTMGTVMGIICAGLIKTFVIGNVFYVNHVAHFTRQRRLSRLLGSSWSPGRALAPFDFGIDRSEDYCQSADAYFSWAGVGP